MFIGHFGIGFGAKAYAPHVSLGTLFLAAQFADLLWPTLVLLGLEHAVISPGITRVVPIDFVHYPYSHSLLALLGWAALLALVYLLLRRYVRGAVVIALAVVSHWVLDFIVHRPDLALYPGSAWRLGLGLWDSLAATAAVELAIFAAGLWLYCRTTSAIDAVGVWALWGLVAVLLIIYAGSLYGPAPPGVNAVIWAGQAQWLLVIWAYWLDGHRRGRRQAAAGGW